MKPKNNDHAMLPLDAIKTNIVSPNYWPQATEYDKANVEFQLPDELEKSFRDFTQVY